MFVRKVKPIQVEHLKEVPRILVRLLAIPTNIRLGLKGLSVTNTSLLRTFVNPGCKKFYNTAPCVVFTKLMNLRIEQHVLDTNAGKQQS